MAVHILIYSRILHVKAPIVHGISTRQDSCIISETYLDGYRYKSKNYTYFLDKSSVLSPKTIKIKSVIKRFTFYDTCIVSATFRNISGVINRHP